MCSLDGFVLFINTYLISPPHGEPAICPNRVHGCLYANETCTLFSESVLSPQQWLRTYCSGKAPLPCHMRQVLLDFCREILKKSFHLLCSVSGPGLSLPVAPDSCPRSSCNKDGISASWQTPQLLFRSHTHADRMVQSPETLGISLDPASSWTPFD